jgi:hypothetical protein
MDNYEEEKQNLIDRHAEQLKDIMVRASVDQYNKGWQGACQHLKDEIIKGIVNDAVISTNVDVNHLERIVRIVEESR